MTSFIELHVYVNKEYPSVPVLVAIDKITSITPYPVTDRAGNISAIEGAEIVVTGHAGLKVVDDYEVICGLMKASC